ncbi:glutamate-rich protein 3-like [Conger conger]|uniref:glutamate-rich protein 3-like n=1 Tax=Conger conger TaxID=82655 RepID=UPI002A5A5293|nr:glutamate-rich protein 3-like [Conger conger]
MHLMFVSLFFSTSFLSAYNSLADKHLAGYFNNTRIRRHLRRAGLITRSGSIVPEKEYRHKLLRRDHQRRIRECLTQAIFHKVLDLERHHRIEIKRKLQDFARKEHVHKIKVQRSKRHNEGAVPSISPRPPSGPRNEHTLHSGPEVEQSESSISPGSSQPNSAPGKRQRPVRLRPLYSNSTTASTQRASHCCRSKDSSDDAEPFLCAALNRETRRHVTMPEFSSGISPYRLPVINNYVTPVPPPVKRNERSSKGTANGRTRGRSLRPTTAPIVPAQDSRFHKTTVHSNVSVTMTFYGKAVHLTPDTVDRRDEVKVFQQHCGGENLCVYRGKLAEGEAFQFISRRHLGFPFSLTFFLNGIQVERLSSCCEFRHRRGSRLGGKRGHFGFTVLEGASPCYKCIIALGLDKKPTPPPKRLQRDADTAGRSLQMSGVARKADAEDSGQRAQLHPGLQSSQGQAEHHTLATAAREDHPVESAQKAQDEYEEDFEEEDERVDEEAEDARGSAAVNGVSSGLSEEGRDSHSFSKEDKMEDDHREGKDDEKSGYSDSEVEEEKAEEKKKSSPVCPGSVSPFSGSRKEDPESETEEVKEAMMDNEVDPYSRSTHQGGDTTTGEKPKEGEYLGTGTSGKAEEQPNAYSPPASVTDLDSETHEVHGSEASETSLEESDSSLPSEEKHATKRRVHGQQAKSVQEQLTAAVTKETHFGSELEMSDSSSDQDEPPTTDPDRTPEPDQTKTGVEAVAVAEEKNAGGKATSSDGALNTSNVDLTPLDGELRSVEIVEEQEPGQETEDAHPDMEGEKGKLGDTSDVDLAPLNGELRTLEMGEEQEPGQGTEEVHPDMEGAIEDTDLQAQEPMEKGEESKEEAQESGNSNTGTESQTNPAETVKVGTNAGEGNLTDQVAEDGGALTEGPSPTLQVVEEEKAKCETERRIEEDSVSTTSNEATASILEKQDVRAEGTGEEEEMVEKAGETEVLVDAAVSVAEIRAEHSAQATEISNAEEETESEQEITDTINEITDTLNGGAEMMAGGKDGTEGENKEETETTVEKANDEEQEEEGESQTGTGDTESKTEMTDDTNKEKLSQAMEGEDNGKMDPLVNDDKEEVVGTMTPDVGVNEASTAESEPGAEEGGNGDESDTKTEVGQDKYEKITTMLEDSEVADITVEEAERSICGSNVTEKENTEGETESSVCEKDEGLESEEMSVKEEENVRDPEIKANGLETEIKEGEVEVMYAELGSSGDEVQETPVEEEPKSESKANGLGTEIGEGEMGSTGEGIEKTPVGEEPKSETEAKQTTDQEIEGKSQSIETDMTPATAPEAESLSEETLDMTEGTLVDIEHTGSGMKNGDTLGQREVEEAAESSIARVTVGTTGGVETGPLADEHGSLNEENGGVELKPGEGNPASDSAERDGKTEVPGDSIDVVRGDADMKDAGEEQKVRAAVEPEGGTKAGGNEVNIDTKGLPDESPGNSTLQEKTRVSKSDVTDDGLEMKAEDESSAQTKRQEEIEEPEKETPGVEANVTECDVEGSEGKLEDSWVHTDRRDPHGQEEGTTNNTETGREGSETSNGEGLGSHKPGSAALEVESIAAESMADGVKGRPEEELGMMMMADEEEATAEKKEGQDAAVLEKTCHPKKSRDEPSMLRSKTELRIGTKFPPPLIRRSGSYTLTIAREGLSLQTLAGSDRETENPLAYVQAAAAIAENAFTASNQKLQHIDTQDM